MLQVVAGDGHKLGVYCAKPTGPIKGGIVVIQEIFGVNHHIRKICDKYAKDGYIAVAPALFDRISPNTELSYNDADTSKGMEFMQFLRWNAVINDVEATANLLESMNPGKLAIVGYCYGGTVAWKAATQLNNFQASICYYGGQIAQFADEKPNCPVMMHFGKKDAHITAEHVQSIRTKHPEITIHMYDANHAFNCDERGNYDAPSADLAYKRTLEFLSNHIKQ